MTRPRHHATCFVLLPGVAFERCEGCGAALAGVRRWRWMERGQAHCACTVCLPMGRVSAKDAA